VSGQIDLHSHTNESDGTLTPPELIALANNTGLDALAITDHDTFAGYEKALPFAREAGLDLVHGIELNTRFYPSGQPDSEARSVHLLAYFLAGEPTPKFHNWLAEQREERLSRNRKLVTALRDRDVDITLAEVEARGRSLTGRPHFAGILVEKGYAKDLQDAFARYLGEQAPSYVLRESKTTGESIQVVLDGGGIPVIAHPVRIGLTRDQEPAVLRRFKDAGLIGLEIFHSEHSAQLQAHYRRLAEEIGLQPTGGSDFHGALKPNVKLGSGTAGNVSVPRQFLDDLRSFADKIG
jgi:3',5'-nucleoside bisphosphate phosphatase